MPRVIVMATSEQPAVAADPDIIYVNTKDGEPYQMESLCMNCYETVSACMYARGGLCSTNVGKVFK